MGRCVLISAKDAESLISNDAIIIDIREDDEYARERILGAVNVPLSSWQSECFDSFSKDKPLIFHCQSGNRTKQSIEKIQALGWSQSYILDGGLMAWKQSGNTTQSSRSKPFPIMRQVQIVIGTMVLLGVILSYGVSPAFNLLSAFFGAGLLFAGITGSCGLANLLMRLPFNKK